MAERLEDLLRACTVRVLGGPMPGAGFFVAPGRVLTCFHVIGEASALTVQWERDGQAPVEVPVSGRTLILADRGHPIPALERDYPDIAVLALDGLDVHPCVGIDAEWPSHEDSFQVFGYPQEGGAVQLTPARLAYRGIKGVRPTIYLDLASDTVKRGMSGAAVLNLRSGAVCGVIVASKHPAQPHGALAIPWSAIDTDLTDVLAANRAFQLRDRRWDMAVAPGRGAGAVGAAALGQLPAGFRQGSSPSGATVREIRKRTGVLTGREGDLAAIASFASGNESYRWLVGQAWAGKTALLAEAVATVSGDVDVVCYFLSRREADADSPRFLAAVVPQLASLLGEDPPAADLYQFRTLWQRASDRASTNDRHLVLVVDGLDEDLRPPGLPSVAAVLPASAGGHAHVVVSSRPHLELPADIPAGHPLRHTRPVPLVPFSGAQELAVLARQEIDNLLRQDDNGLAADVLGLLAAAAGPLAVRDLAAMTTVTSQCGALTRRIRELLTLSAARSLQAAGPAGSDRYQFAHESLLAYAQADDDLSNPDYRLRIDQWAEQWRTAGWPTPAGGDRCTPLYLLDTYPATLIQDRQRLIRLVSDIGWLEAAIPAAGVDPVLADLRRAAANSADTSIAAVLAAVAGQTYNLRSPQPFDQPGYVLRQLWMQAAELAADDLADDIRGRLEARPGPGLVPLGTTRRTSRALSCELGRHNGFVDALAVLPDGRVISAGTDKRVLIWNPAAPETGPARLGRHRAVESVTVMADGRVVTGGSDGQVLVWDRAALGVGPVDLGRHNGSVKAAAVLADGRVVTSGSDGQVLVWDPAAPGVGPVDLGRHDGTVFGMAALPGSRVVTGADDGALVWDPAHAGAGPTDLGDHSVGAVAVLTDGRVVIGGNDGRVQVQDPDAPRIGLAELGDHDGPVYTMAVLADGRVVTAGDSGRILVWDPDRPGVGPVGLGRHDGRVLASAALADGRVVTSGDDGRVLVWDPAAAAIGPVDLGRNDSWVVASAILTGRRVVTGGEDGRVLLWDLADPASGPVDLGHHDYGSWVAAVTALDNGRVVTAGFDGRVLVWDPAAPRTGPVELGRCDNGVYTLAALADGRVVTAGHDGRVLVWDPAAPGTGPVELGRQSDAVSEVAVLTDGRVITYGEDGWVLIWDPATPGADPVELDRHDGVQAIAVLANGQVVTGSRDRQVLVRDPARATTQVVQLSCSVTALATAPLDQGRSHLAIAHEGSGFSLWSFTG